MKEIRWSTLSDTEMEASGNQITIKGAPETDLEVRIIEKKGDKIVPVERFVDIKKELHKVLIIPKFQWKTDKYQDTNEGNIEYAIKVDAGWKIDKEERKIIVEPGERAKFEQAKKEMHKKLLKEKFNDKIDKDSKLDAKGLDMKYIILPDGNGNYKVKIYWGDKNEDNEFPWEQVEIEPNYWQNKAIDFDNANNVIYLEAEKKPRWTTGWVVFSVALAVAATLLIVFWKKIWRWIKGEREQEKKVKEQLDIF